MDQKKRTEIASLGQFGLIDLLTSGFTPKNASTLKGAGDDAAVIAPGRGEAVLCTTDSFYEGVDFDLTYFPLKHLGYKAVTVAGSDILAMNARPSQLMVSLGVSAKMSVEALQELYEGIAFACREQGIDLVGGDTKASVTGLVLSLTAAGHAPKERIVAREIAQVERLGVGIETDVIVGRTVTIDSLLDDEGYDAVFIGSGAGLPRFMGIPGENLNGVVSANEFLTRTNLMKAYDTHYDTPIYVGQRVVVVGGGNVAMDAVRTAKRLGAEATIVYRRSEKELPARVEEVHHAKEEGIEFRMLTNPTSIIGDEKGWVVGISCVEMELGEPDESGRRSPIEKAGSDFEIPCDVVIMALGTSPNPLLKMTTEWLDTIRKGCLVAEEKGASTSEGFLPAAMP